MIEKHFVNKTKITLLVLFYTSVCKKAYFSFMLSFGTVGDF